MNSSSIWKRVVEKLASTRALDRQCQAFGAELHRYQLNPTPAPQELTWAEEALGAPFPDELRTFYREVGDGGAGPGYGIYPSSELGGYRPGNAYPGLEALTQAARAAGWNPEEEECLRIGSAAQGPRSRASRTCPSRSSCSAIRGMAVESCMAPSRLHGTRRY